MDKLLIFFLNHSFLDIVEKSKTGFSKLESSSHFCIILNGAQNIKFRGFIYATLIG